VSDRAGEGETQQYYDRHAAEFFSGTVGVDMAPLVQRFLDRLPAGAAILDAGCGSGRDARTFAERGYQVSAFDASPTLAALASQHCGFAVAVRRFEELDDVACHDGIWCCASLLHVAEADMADVLARLWRALRPGGTLYVSFKHGRGERLHHGRRFTDADEPTLRAWLPALPQSLAPEIWLTEDRRPDRTEHWTNALIQRAPQHRLVTGGDHDHLLIQLSAACARATQVDLAVAFVKTSGLRLLWVDLQAVAHDPARRLRLLTSDYLGITDPEALRLLLLLQEQGAEVRVHATQGGSFHLKAYLFARLAHGELLDGTAFVGSSNISGQALRGGLEWNYRIVHPGDAGFLEVRRRFDELFVHPRNAPLTDVWIEDYEQRRTPPAPRLTHPDPTPDADASEAPPEPTPVQREALAALAATRQQGYRRGLVVLATGLGKTWLAAFDTVQLNAQRILFVAHREEILTQAAATFLRIRPQTRIGHYTGRSRDTDVDVLCASVQTLGRLEHLHRFAPQHFDYIVVDEFHHAAASTYRRLLTHFAPTFLLGLTATPDRTDQSDILSLCDDNLVHTCPLFDGIRAGLLAPFHYFGIFDESVDYREIPWRNGRFDPTQLDHQLATLARARHAMKEWRQRSQKRTLAFCISRRHAEFMAEQFRREGVAAAAVYAGSDLGRAEALEHLGDGTLQVLFSVDLFNEGVDLPGIDTVMLLRPTESKILFLQQLGRGLRRHADKTHLVVLDFIGNHRAFLRQPQALCEIGASHQALASFAVQVEQQTLDLPPGCFIHYDLRIIDFLKALDSQGPRHEYEALRDRLGHRPSLTEYHHSGASVQAMRRQAGHWFALVRSQGDLNDEEATAADRFGALLREVETAPMTRSFKMVLLEAFLELDGLRTPVPLAELNRRSREVLERRRPLLADLTPEARAAAVDSPAWAAYWRKNPIQAWTGGNRHAGTARYFGLEGDRFSLLQEVPALLAEPLTGLLQELVDYCLASYAVRRTSTEDSAESGQVIPFPNQLRATGAGIALPFFPDLKMACGHFKTGRTDAETLRWLPARYGPLDPARHFIARAAGHSMDGGKHPIRDGDYLLLERVSPSRAGSITGSVMAIERQDESGDSQYLLRVVTKNASGQYVLQAQNPAFADMPTTDDMRTLARLRAVIDPLDLTVDQSS
jgi:superfamily II DNA or RNA helicase/HKD family nuclease